MANRKGKFKVKNGSGSYDQVMLETQLGQVVDSPIKSLERNTYYEQNDVVAEQTCKGTFLVCTTAGTTAASAPSGYSSVAEGGSVTDGTAVFTAHRFNNLANIAAIIAHNALETAHENRFKLFEKIADFGDNLIKKLALTTAITAITALETNSWFGQLLKMVLTASGVRYNIADNGYICFGYFFGGLIIQWGNKITVTNGGYGASINYPIIFANKALAVISYDTNAGWDGSAIPSVHAAWFPGEGSDDDGNDRRWARIGFSEKSSTFGTYRYIAIGK